jgi:hypothetical protein
MKNLKIIITTAIIAIISLISFNITCTSGTHYNLGEFVPFEYPVPDGMITDEDEKMAMIQAKIENLEATNRVFWGEIPADVDTMLKLFQAIWGFINTNFPGFPGIMKTEDNPDGIDWDEFGEWAYEEIEYIDNYGDFANIMTRMAYVLKEGHSQVIPGRLKGAMGLTSYRENAPVFIPFSAKVSTIGACYTVTEEEELVVTYIIDDENPYDLRPGDEIVGFNGIPWAEWLPYLIEADIPYYGSPASSEGAIRYNLLKSGMTNARLFEKINIKEYRTGEIVTKPILYERFTWTTTKPCTEHFVSVPGVPDPQISFYATDPLYYGIMEGTNIGYIYLTSFPSGWDEFDDPSQWDPYETEFSGAFNRAIVELMDTDGLIIDIRQHGGGWQQVSYKGFAKLIDADEDILIFKQVNRDTGNPAKDAFEDDYSRDFPLKADDSHYENPIIVITGPDCISGGDLITAFFDKFPEFTIIGNHNNGAFTAVGAQEYQVGNDTVFQYIPTIGLYYHDDPNPNLLRRSDFVDIHVRQNKEDIVKGVDAVREYALKLIREKKPDA